MAVYATVEKAYRLYGESFVNTSVRLTDDVDDPQPDLDTLTYAFVKASSEIDSYLTVQYSIPLTTVPEIVVQCCIDMGIYRTSADAGTGTDEKRKRYDDALRWLRDLAKGLSALPDAGDEGPASQTPEYVTSTRLFSRSSMRGL